MPDPQYLYRHTQRSRLQWLILIPAALLVVPVQQSFQAGHLFGGMVGLAGMFLLLAMAYIFSSLTILVTSTSVAWHFGGKFWFKSPPRSQIAAVRRVRTRWWTGWGIRWTGDGWLYNVYGLDAVEITLVDGKRVTLGTDDPDGLFGVLSQRQIVSDF